MVERRNHAALIATKHGLDVGGQMKKNSNKIIQDVSAHHKENFALPPNPSAFG